MAAEEDKGAPQAPTPQVKQNVRAGQCTVQGSAEIKVYASSACATAAAWALVIVTVVLGAAATLAAYFAWNQVQETERMRVADNLPAFLITPLPQGEKAVLGVRLTNMGKGPAIMRAVGLVVDEVYYRLGLPENHKYFVPPRTHFDFPNLSFDDMATKYAQHNGLSGVANFLALGEHLRMSSQHPSEESFTIDCFIEYADVCGRVHRQHYFFDIMRFEKRDPEYICPGRYRLLSTKAEEKPPAPETVVELGDLIPSIPPPEGPANESLRPEGSLSPASTTSGSGPASGEPVPYMPKEVPR